MQFSQNGKKKQRGQGIVKISDLFKKYAETLQAPQGVVVDAFIDAVHVVLGVRLEKEQCSYTVQTKTLMVRAPGIIKTEIKKQQKQLLDHMRETVGAKSIPKTIL